MSVLAPWLRGTDVLAAMSGGGHLGLSARQADQRDAEMQMQAELAAQREQQNAQEAAARLRYSYDALEQARQNSVRDDDFRKEDRDASRLLKMDEMDALALYRAGTLKNQADRTEGMKTVADLRAGHPIHVGGNLLQFDPATGSVKTLFSAPEKNVAPMVTGVPLDPQKPYGVKINARANDPILNELAGTNSWGKMTGTNFAAPMPKLAPKAPAPSPVAVPAPAATPEPIKKLDVATAGEFLKLAKGDRKKAEQLARDAGYTF